MRCVYVSSIKHRRRIKCSYRFPFLLQNATFFSTIYGPDRHINSERVKRHWQTSKKRHWKRKIWGPSRQCQNKAINPLKNLRQKGKVQQQAQAKSGVKKRVKLLFILYSNRFVSISIPPEPELVISCTTDFESEDQTTFFVLLQFPLLWPSPGCSPSSSPRNDWKRIQNPFLCFAWGTMLLKCCSRDSDVCKWI